MAPSLRSGTSKGLRVLNSVENKGSTANRTPANSQSIFSILLVYGLINNMSRSANQSYISCISHSMKAIQNL